jgi:tetratricopeptide (TPR) repeat protein
VNEEIDKALGLLDLGKSQEALTKFFLLLGRIEDKDGFRHEKARLYNNIGVAYNLQRQTDRAIEYFQKAVNTEENFTVGLTNLSAAYITKGEEAKGEIEKQKFIKNAEMILQPLWEEFSDKSATSVLQVQMRLLRTKEGIPGLITFIKNQSNNLPAKHFSSNATLAFMVASTYLEAHEPELALDYAKKAYDLDKDDPETLFLRGRSYMSIAIKENAPISATYWTDILPVFSKKENLKKALKDIDETIDDAASKGMEFILPQAYFLQSMGNIWAGEEIKPLPSIEMEGMEDQKHFLEFVLSFRKRDYEHSYAILKSLDEYGNIPYEEKFRIARAYLYHGQPEIAKELFDSIKDEATKRENVLYWMDYSVVATLLGEKNSAILSAAKAREVATGERRRDDVYLC